MWERDDVLVTDLREQREQGLGKLLSGNVIRCQMQDWGEKEFFWLNLDSGYEIRIRIRAIREIIDKIIDERFREKLNGGEK